MFQVIKQDSVCLKEKMKLLINARHPGQFTDKEAIQEEDISTDFEEQGLTSTTVKIHQMCILAQLQQVILLDYKETFMKNNGEHKEL